MQTALQLHYFIIQIVNLFLQIKRPVTKYLRISRYSIFDLVGIKSRHHRLALALIHPSISLRESHWQRIVLIRVIRNRLIVLLIKVATPFVSATDSDRTHVGRTMMSTVSELLLLMALLVSSVISRTVAVLFLELTTTVISSV